MPVTRQFDAVLRQDARDLSVQRRLRVGRGVELAPSEPAGQALEPEARPCVDRVERDCVASERDLVAPPGVVLHVDSLRDLIDHITDEYRLAAVQRFDVVATDALGGRCGTPGALLSGDAAVLADRATEPTVEVLRHPDEVGCRVSWPGVNANLDARDRGGRRKWEHLLQPREVASYVGGRRRVLHPDNEYGVGGAGGARGGLDEGLDTRV